MDAQFIDKPHINPLTPPTIYRKPEPTYISPTYRSSERLMKKVVLIAGCDPAIGRSVAVHFAREGAHLILACRQQDQCGRYTKYLVEAEGRACTILSGNLADADFKKEVGAYIVQRFGAIDVLVNNMNYEKPDRLIAFTQAMLPYLQQDSCIINTEATSTAATATMAKSMLLKNIRVNGVVADVGENGTDDDRQILPAKVGPVFVFLASSDAEFVNGQVIEINKQSVIMGKRPS